MSVFNAVLIETGKRDGTLFDDLTVIKANKTFVWETISGQRITGRYTVSGNRIKLGSAGWHYWRLAGQTLRLRTVGAPADAIGIYIRA